MNNKNKIFVDLTILKNEAKSIYKKNNKILEYTKILDILLTNLNFKSYNEYQRYFKNQVDSYNTDDISEIDIYNLSLIENNILLKLKQFDCVYTDKIFFIRNMIHDRINKQLNFYPNLTLIQILSVYRNINLKFLNLIQDNKIDKTILKELTIHLIEKIYNFEINNFNLFSLYSICLKELSQIDNIEESINKNNFNINPLELRIFKSALNNLKTNDNNGEGQFFDYLYNIYISNNEIDEKIEKMINIIDNDEIEYRKKFKHYNKNEIDNNIYISYPSFNININENLTLFFKKQTDINHPLYIGEEIKPIFKNNLTLNIQESKENKLFIGSCGSGKDESILNILFQHIINNKSIIYFDFIINNSFFYKLYYLSVNAGRANDFCYFFDNEENLKKKIISAYKSNKIIFVFPLNSVEKSTENNINKYYNFVEEIIENINYINKNKKSTYLSDIIYFSSDYIYKSDLFNSFSFKLILKTTKLCILSSTQDYYMQKDIDYLSCFKFQFIMKVEDINFLDNLPFEYIDRKCLRQQKAGEFILFKYENDIFKLLKQGYKFKYLDFKMSKYNTLITKK